MNKQIPEHIKVEYVPVNQLKDCGYNPRKWDDQAVRNLTESIERFGMIDPIIVNSAPGRENIIIGGHFRWYVAKLLKMEKVPVVFIFIPDLEKEKELNLRLNKNTGEFNWEILADFDQSLLEDVGFSSQEMDEIFPVDVEPETFDLEKELKKLDINKIEMQKGEVWQLGTSRLMVGDSTIESDVLRLMDGEKADFCLTDPPYILDYLKGKKKHGEATTGFGLKRDRRYLETDVLPDDFTEKWMANVAKIAKPDFHIICYENWKNIRTIWNEMEKYWKVRNMIVWRLPNRTQGFAGKYKFFSKHDIAMVGSSGKSELNLENEEELLENEYRAALYATCGSPYWEPYKKGKKICPTDFIDYKAADEKSSGQGIIFGTKPTQILVPYVKVLTQRNDLIFEPFGGSGSTLIAATMMKRRCYLMEKSNVYAEVIRKRWEKLTGEKAVRIN